MANEKKVAGIKGWPDADRPREKLLRNGEHTLSDSELLAILLRSGVKGNSAIDLGRKILAKFKTFRNMGHTDIREWKEIKGLGEAKICQLKAAIEIARRINEVEAKEYGPKIKCAKDAVEIFMPRMRDLKTEVFKILLLDSKNRIIDTIEIVEGTVDKANPIIREIFQKAAQRFATSMICLHNHPSGDSAPSPEDRNFTNDLCQAGKIMQIRVLDHIVIGDKQHFSFADKGLL